MFEPDGTPAAGNYPAAVVWDLDGTLVESAPDLATALYTVLEAHGQSTHGVDAVRLMIGGGVPKLIERGFRAANAPLDDAEIQAIVPEFMRIYSACATNNTYLVDHAREALEHLHQAGVSQGLCTNKPISVTRKILAALEVEHYFGSVIGGDSTARRKPVAFRRSAANVPAATPTTMAGRPLASRRQTSADRSPRAPRRVSWNTVLKRNTTCRLALNASGLQRRAVA